MCGDSDLGATFGREVACYRVWPRDRNSLSRAFIIGAPPLCVLQVQTDVQMKFFIELLNGDRTQPNTDATYRTYGTASTDYILPRFSSLLAHNTKTKLELYRHQSLHITARNEAAVPTGPNYHGYLFLLYKFPPGYRCLTAHCLPPIPRPHPPPLLGAQHHCRLPIALHRSNFASIAHIGVIAQGCAFTNPVSWVFDMFRIAHIGVIAQGYAPEREIKSLI